MNNLQPLMNEVLANFAANINFSNNVNTHQSTTNNTIFPPSFQMLNNNNNNVILPSLYCKFL